MFKVPPSIPTILIGLGLCGCGSTLPVMDLRHPTKDAFDDFVLHIAAHVGCELREAVKAEMRVPLPSRKVLDTWAAKVALTIRALDKGNVNPTVSAFTTPMRFLGSIGGQFEADGTREMVMTYFVTFEELKQDPAFVDERGISRDCDELRHDEEPISGNLGIRDTLSASLQAMDSVRTLSWKIKGGPFDTITHHVTFAVIAGVDVTPTWKLVNVSANTVAPFLGATRTRTDDLLVTMGPAVLGSRKEVAPSQALNDAFLVERLRGAIGNNIVTIEGR